MTGVGTGSGGVMCWGAVPRRSTAARCTASHRGAVPRCCAMALHRGAAPRHAATPHRGSGERRAGRSFLPLFLSLSLSLSISIYLSLSIYIYRYCYCYCFCVCLSISLCLPLSLSVPPPFLYIAACPGALWAQHSMKLYTRTKIKSLKTTQRVQACLRQIMCKGRGPGETKIHTDKITVFKNPSGDFSEFPKILRTPFGRRCACRRLFRNPSKRIRGPPGFAGRTPKHVRRFSKGSLTRTAPPKHA
jgi:hypothetical protein